MSNSNTYKIVIPPGSGYPLFVPVDPKKSKAKWLPYGRRVTPVVLAGGKSEDYLKQRYAAVRAADHEADQERISSYPRIVERIMKEDN
jgi:hypothetical protein